MTSIARISAVGPQSETSPLAVLRMVLSNPADLDVVKQSTTDDFADVSLNYESPELQQAMPWAGTSAGTEGLVQTFIDVNRSWTVDDFQIQDSVENDDGAAIFGTFTYTLDTLGNTVSSPFAVLARCDKRNRSYIQFMEDTFATFRSFRESVSFHNKTNPDGSETNILGRFKHPCHG